MKRILAVLLLALVADGCVGGLTMAGKYSCGGDVIPLAGLTGPPAGQLGPDGRAALRGREVRPPADLAAWHVVEESAERVALISDPGPDRRYLVIERFGPGGSWHLRQSGGCDLRRVVPGHGAAELAVASASGDRLNLWVTEMACASGRPATGRITLVELEETDREVRIAVAVRAQYGGMTCPGNPRTPFAVDLAEPLGDRVVVDSGVYGGRRL